MAIEPHRALRGGPGGPGGPDEEPIIGWAAAAYLAIGLWLVHTLHVCRHLLVDLEQITAFPAWRIETWTALWAGAAVPLVALAGVWAIRRSPRAITIVLVALVCELVSQATGRSLITAAGDATIWGVVIGSALVRRFYSPAVVAAEPTRSLPALHSEALGILRALVTICLFALGSLGVAVASLVVSAAFDGEPGDDAAWVQVGSVVYLAAGMVGLILWPLLITVRTARARIGAPERASDAAG